MADEQQARTRNEVRQQQQEELQKRRAEDLEKVTKLVNAIAGTPEGVGFLVWMMDASGVNEATVMNHALTTTGTVDPFLAGYAEGRRSFAAFIRARLLPENLVKTMKRGE